MSKKRTRDKILRYLNQNKDDRRLSLNNIWTDISQDEVDKQAAWLAKRNFIMGSKRKGGYRIDSLGQSVLNVHGTYQRYRNSEIRYYLGITLTGLILIVAIINLIMHIKESLKLE